MVIFRLHSIEQRMQPGAITGKIIIDMEYEIIISWPTLFVFEVACSLIVLYCTLRKIQQNIKVGGAKLLRAMPV